MERKNTVLDQSFCAHSIFTVPEKIDEILVKTVLSRFSRKFWSFHGLSRFSDKNSGRFTVQNFMVPRTVKGQWKDQNFFREPWKDSERTIKGPEFSREPWNDHFHKKVIQVMKPEFSAWFSAIYYEASNLGCFKINLIGISTRKVEKAKNSPAKFFFFFRCSRRGVQSRLRETPSLPMHTYGCEYAFWYHPIV